MRLSQLFGKHQNKTVYIIGTGPSLRFFPVDFLKDKLTIGLNQAWQSLSFQCTYNLTIHPDECIPKNFYNRKQTWITKHKGWLANNSHPAIYWFENNKNVKCYKYLTARDDLLYIGRGIHTGALCLASKMGCSHAILIGCDFGAVDDQHHATGQSVQFHGLPPSEVYREYYLNFQEIRKRLHDSLKILYLTPFVGLNYQFEEYQALLQLSSLKPLDSPEDVSTYSRKGVDF